MLRYPVMITGTLLLTCSCAARPGGSDGAEQRAIPQPTPAPSQPTSQPASVPRGRVAFQPGVAIDWGEREAVVDGRVTLQTGPLEFLACFEGKEYESVVRLEASGTHIFMALGLLGLTPGHPPVWDHATQTHGRPAGDLLALSFEWSQDGRRRTADAFSWLREIEYARTPTPRPWVFAGSQARPDRTLACDDSGVAVAVVDFGDSLICLSTRHSSQNAELWLEANTAAIPPEGTPVKLVLRPARPVARRVEVDFRGVIHIDGRFARVAELTDLILLARQLDPRHVQTVQLRGTLVADAAELRRRLAEAGVPSDAIRFAGGESAVFLEK